MPFACQKREIRSEPFLPLGLLWKLSFILDNLDVCYITGNSAGRKGLDMLENDGDGGEPGSLSKDSTTDERRQVSACLKKEKLFSI